MPLGRRTGGQKVHSYEAIPGYTRLIPPKGKHGYKKNRKAPASGPGLLYVKRWIVMRPMAASDSQVSNYCSIG